jgi:MFS family permease
MNRSSVLSARPGSSKSRLTPNQIRGFWGAWGGWTVDGLDAFISALVLVPALRDLLPRSGMSASTANLGFYGGILFALLLVGWALAFIWGPVADRFGRVSTLILSLVCYSLFTLLSAAATNVWILAVSRLLVGLTMGGQWSMAGTFLAEKWPEDRRTMGAGLMQTGYYVGLIVAAVANNIIGLHFGWRAMYVLGGSPALIIAYIYYRVKEPERWERKHVQLEGKLTATHAFFSIFSPQYRRRTILNTVYVFVSLAGFWGGAAYVPASVTLLATKSGLTEARGAALANYATMLLASATILGCLIMPVLADGLGRRAALGVGYFCMLVALAVAFGYVFYLKQSPVLWFMVCLILLGLGGANFVMYPIWLPEQYPTECRASAFAFSTSVGRFASAWVTFLVGAGIRHFQTMGTPVALTSIIFVVGLLLLPFGKETRGEQLPA